MGKKIDFFGFLTVCNILCVLGALFIPSGVGALTIRMVTTLGNIDVELYESVAPATVQNFLKYVDDGVYTNSLIHRSVPGFVIQGGGFRISGNAIEEIPTDPPVVNEFSISNTRGTIAMAKLAGDPDSATSQWFFNLGDNSENLDLQNGGFTVFGRTSGAGLQVVDAIAGLEIYDASEYLTSAFSQLPLLDNVLALDTLVVIERIELLIGPGDLDGNGSVNLADGVLALQLIGGFPVAVDIPEAADVASDGIVGLDEAIYVLQTVAGLRAGGDG